MITRLTASHPSTGDSHPRAGHTPPGCTPPGPHNPGCSLPGGQRPLAISPPAGHHAGRSPRQHAIMSSRSAGSRCPPSQVRSSAAPPCARGLEAVRTKSIVRRRRPRDLLPPSPQLGAPIRSFHQLTRGSACAREGSVLDVYFYYICTRVVFQCFRRLAGDKTTTPSSVFSAQRSARRA